MEHAADRGAQLKHLPDRAARTSAASDMLRIGQRTAAEHLRRGYPKLGCTNRFGALRLPGGQ